MDVSGADLNRMSTGFDQLCGLTYEGITGGVVRAHVEVGDDHLQPFGLVHGGLYATIAESVASFGTAVGVGEGFMASGMSNNTSFLRPAFKDDVLTAVGRPIHQGRTTWVWDVTITGQAGKPIATTRVTIAVRPRQD